MKPPVALEGVSVRYGARLALDDLSLQLEPGQITALLGPNGAGKTTTLDLIGGLRRPDGGRVRVFGADPRRAETRRLVGLAPQASALYSRLSARENLALFGQLYGLRGAARCERVEAGLALADLADRALDPVRALSGGMQRRLSLAIAAVHDPPLLLLDEPTTGVDPQSRERIYQRVRELRDAGKTVLVSTHLLDEASELCDRVLILDRGRAVAAGEVAALIAEHGGHRELTVGPCDEATAERLRAAGAEPLASGGWRLRCERPLALIGELAAGGMGEVELELRRPDLGDVFFALTGKALRD